MYFSVLRDLFALTKIILVSLRLLLIKSRVPYHFINTNYSYEIVKKLYLSCSNADILRVTQPLIVLMLKKN